MSKLPELQAFINERRATLLAIKNGDIIGAYHPSLLLPLDMLQAALNQCKDHQDVRLADAFYDAEDEADAMRITAQRIIDAMHGVLGASDD